VLTFAPPDELPLTVKIRIEMDDTLLIDVVAYWTPPGDEPIVFDRVALTKHHAQLLKRLEVAAAAELHDDFRIAADKIAGLLSLADRIEAVGPLPFRVVMNVDGQQVVVLQSDRTAGDETSLVPAAAE
jgi:hypothetical protein